MFGKTFAELLRDSKSVSWAGGFHRRVLIGFSEGQEDCR